MDKLVIIGIVIGLVVVGGIGVFSIYLQQDEAIVEFSRITNPNYQCLEKWDYLQQSKQEDPNARFTEKNKTMFSEFINANCVNTFRTWMSESHRDWNEFIISENNFKANCELYVKGELVLKEWEKSIWKEKGCKEFLKGFD